MTTLEKRESLLQQIKDLNMSYRGRYASYSHMPDSYMVEMQKLTCELRELENSKEYAEAQKELAALRAVRCSAANKRTFKASKKARAFCGMTMKKQMKKGGFIDKSYNIHKKHKDGKINLKEQARQLSQLVEKLT